VSGVFVAGSTAADSVDPVRVRSRQRLADGDLLEVSQRPLPGGDFAEEMVVVPRRRLGRPGRRPQAEAAPATPPAARAELGARSSATVALGGFELTVEGGLDAQTLRSLARNAVPLAAPSSGADAP
jgi:hypothetical protein